MIQIRSKNILLPDRILDGSILLDGNRIAAILPADRACELPALNETYDVGDSFVSAGFIDLHTHGGGGYAFENGCEAVVRGCEFHLLHGTTSICPTVSAAPIAKMERATEGIAEAMHDPRVRGTILGAHLEGPYLSREQAGAQCADFITPPDPEGYLPLLARHADHIVRWSYAPENDADGTFARTLCSYGILPAAGHTAAILDDMIHAEENGCRLVTHLYSCTSTVTRDHGFRRLGVIESVFLSDTLFAEIICDGKHLPPELIRMIYKIVGANRLALITDSLALTGTAITRGRMEATDFIIEDGVCKLLDRTAFAGSIATADRLLRVAVKEAGIPLPEAVRMLTETPARILNLDHKGRIAVGADADLVVLDPALNVESVFAHGIRIS